jgi:hypothetical protein
MVQSGKRQRRLSDGYSFVGFRAQATIRGVFGDRDLRIVQLDRRSKKLSAIAAGVLRRAGTIDGHGTYATCRAPGFASSWNSTYGALRAVSAAP